MNLRKKKILASKTLGIGKNKIIFAKSRLDEIKEAITKQDIRDLYESKAILIKDVKGRKKIKRKKKREDIGNIRKKISNRKRKYIVLTRKLRKRLAEWKKNNKVSGEQLSEIRKKIKNKIFKNKAHFNEYLKSLNIHDKSLKKVSR
jgi:large subunit ribosomal protein L19e